LKYRYTKRAFDLIILVLFTPVIVFTIIVLSLLIIFFLGKPVFFLQSRIGFKGKEFKIIKFRSMKNIRDVHGNLLADEFRLTKFGKFLRNSSLDEIPCLINVYLGQMTLVGPRPFISKYRDLYSPKQFSRHDVTPGITGWAQVNGRNAISWEEKFRLDIEYVDEQSFWLDCKILWMTFLNVIKRKDISADGHATMEEFKGTNQQN
jgi:lipopolysaccharide/colanic/teichoic acid biosynthesis glycosyltransferase